MFSQIYPNFRLYFFTFPSLPGRIHKTIALLCIVYTIYLSKTEREPAVKLAPFHFIRLNRLQNDGLCYISRDIIHLQGNVTFLSLALYDDHKFAREEFHLWLGERFQRSGIPITSRLEDSFATYLKGQFIIT